MQIWALDWAACHIPNLTSFRVQPKLGILPSHLKETSSLTSACTTMALFGISVKIHIMVYLPLTSCLQPFL